MHQSRARPTQQIAGVAEEGRAGVTGEKTKRTKAKKVAKVTLVAVAEEEGGDSSEDIDLVMLEGEEPGLLVSRVP